METTFEKLNDQEMINVVGGETKIIKYIDKDGNVVYIIIEEGDEESPNP